MIVDVARAADIKSLDLFASLLAIELESGVTIPFPMPKSTTVKAEVNATRVITVPNDIDPRCPRISGSTKIVIARLTRYEKPFVAVDQSTDLLREILKLCMDGFETVNDCTTIINLSWMRNYGQPHLVARK